MRKIEQAPRSAAEKGYERPQIEARDARKRRHSSRRVVGGRGADLDDDPRGVAPGTDLRQVRRAPTTEFAEAMTVDAALPDENLLAAVCARTRCDDRTREQAEEDHPGDRGDDEPSHDRPMIRHSGERRNPVLSGCRITPGMTRAIRDC